MQKIRTTITTGVASLGLVVGMAGFAGATSGTIQDTGRNSDNKVKNTTRWTSKVRNTNKVEAENNNDQTARSGEARSLDNRGGGDARTGNASNSSTARTSVSVHNGGGSAAHMPAPAASGTIRDTGRNSDNKVVNTNTYKSTVNNDNEVMVTNNNTQTATSGDATVRDNRGGGDATTGNASNTSSTTTTVSIRN